MASRHRPGRELHSGGGWPSGLAWLAWVLLGVAGYRHNGAPALKDTVGALQLVFWSLPQRPALGRWPH